MSLFSKLLLLFIYILLKLSNLMMESLFKLFKVAIDPSISSFLRVRMLEARKLELILLLPKSRYIVFEFFF